MTAADRRQVVIVAAVATNGVIGNDNGLPWHIPEDLRRFRALTLGHPVIMGRRTFQSIGRPLPQRTNIVLSRDRSFAADGCVVCQDLGSAVDRAKALDDDDVVFVIGGANVYGQALEVADRIELTVVNRAFPGDAYFPSLDATRWTCESSHGHCREDDPELTFEFRTYLRTARAPAPRDGR